MLGFVDTSTFERIGLVEELSTAGAAVSPEEIRKAEAEVVNGLVDRELRGDSWTDALEDIAGAAMLV
jgi:hypothetical protein